MRRALIGWRWPTISRLRSPEALTKIEGIAEGALMAEKYVSPADEVTGNTIRQEFQPRNQNLQAGKKYALVVERPWLELELVWLDGEKIEGAVAEVVSGARRLQATTNAEGIARVLGVGKSEPSAVRFPDFDDEALPPHPDAPPAREGQLYDPASAPVSCAPCQRHRFLFAPWDIALVEEETGDEQDDDPEEPGGVTAPRTSSGSRPGGTDADPQAAQGDGDREQPEEEPDDPWELETLAHEADGDQDDEDF